MTNNQPDNEIISRIRTGDRKAYEELYRRYYPLIFDFARNIVKNDIEGQDITTETFIKIWLQKDKLKEGGDIKAFLYTITRNACFDHLRSKQRRNASHGEILYLSNEMEILNDFASIDLNLIEKKVIQDINSRIEKLPPKCRQVFKLIFFQGKKILEVAKQLGISPRTVQNHKTSAIRQLRNAFLRNDLSSSD